MQVIESLSEMRAQRAKINKEVGFVPTMGYLHDGHLALIRRATAENPVVIVSIFVNPTQFGPSEDFQRYPRDLPRDLRMLQLEKVDYVFVPSEEEMYPKGFQTSVEVRELSQRLEGSSRPGHFAGVATVVLKFLNIIQPHRAYFGQKDAQQLAVIQRMVKDLNLNVEIVAVPTVRETDGLAFSSRNVYLTDNQRDAALSIVKGLEVAKALKARGIVDAHEIRRRVAEFIMLNPMVTLDYVAVCDPETFSELEHISDGAIVLVAAKIGGVRLIDNIII